MSCGSVRRGKGGATHLSVIQTTTEFSHMPVLFRALVTLPTLSSTTLTIALKVCSSGQLDWCSYRAWKRCAQAFNYPYFLRFRMHASAHLEAVRRLEGRVRVMQGEVHEEGRGLVVRVDQPHRLRWEVLCSRASLRKQSASKEEATKEDAKKQAELT